MKILTKKKLEKIESVNYYEGWTKANKDVTKAWQKETKHIKEKNKAFLLQIAESLEELRKINTGNGIKTKKQKEIDFYIEELQTRILENKGE